MVFRRNIIGAAVGLALSGVAATASAAGFSLAEQGTAGMGVAYSGAAAAVWDASTVWWNPAGMTAIPGRQVVLAGNLVMLSTKFENSGSTLPLGQPPGSPADSGGNAGGTFFVPSFFITWQLAPDWTLGFGVNGPFGLTTKWDDNFVGRFHAIKSQIETYNFNPSIAWKINEMFSVGAGVSAQYLKGEFTSYANYAGLTFGAVQQACLALVPNQAFCQGQANAALGGVVAAGQQQGLVTVKGNDWGWGWNVGATITPAPATRIGLTYRSAIKYKVQGDVSFAGVPTSPPLSPTVAGALGAALQSGSVYSDIKLPEIASIALSQGIGDRWRLLADYTWTGWSSIQQLAFVRTGPGAPLPPTALEFKDSWRIGAGMEFAYSKDWLFRFGTAYDKTPVQDEYRTPRLPDQNRWWFSIGGRYSFSPAAAIDFGYSYLYVKKAPSELTDDPAGTGNLVGNYSANTNIFGVQFRYNF